MSTPNLVQVLISELDQYNSNQIAKVECTATNNTIKSYEVSAYL